MMKSPLSKLIPFGLAFLLTGRAFAQQDTLKAAGDLYASAAYEESLVVLDGLAKSNSQATDAFAINQYRAFCLLALGRTAEAEHAIEAQVSDKPLYRPSDAEASPRLRAAFTVVRQRMLPSIVQQKYAQAKSAFDQKDFPAAEAGFGQVLDVLADGDLASAASRPPLSDLSTLAAGFRELSARAVAQVRAVEAAQQAANEHPEVVAPSAQHIYNRGETNVMLPIIVRQDMPPISAEFGSIADGVLEIVIDEAGLVENAVMRSSMNVRYDRLALLATKNWKFKPATVDGLPVKFRKLIAIATKPGD